MVSDAIGDSDVSGNEEPICNEKVIGRKSVRTQENELLRNKSCNIVV